MGQKEVLRFLKENPEEWFTTKVIEKWMDQNQNSICVNLKKLRSMKAVRCIYRMKQQGGYLYKHKENKKN